MKLVLHNHLGRMDYDECRRVVEHALNKGCAKFRPPEPPQNVPRNKGWPTADRLNGMPMTCCFCTATEPKT